MKKIYAMFALGLFLLTIFSTFYLTAPFASADSGAVINVALNVPTACSLTLVGGINNEETLSTTVNPGTRVTIGSSSMKAVCNDPNGLAVYAVGYSDDTYGNTNLISTNESTNTIATNYTVDNPSSSEWYMSLVAESGTYAPIILDGTGNTEDFTSNHAIPNVYTKVAYRNSNTDVNADGYDAIGASFTATFGAYVSASQPSGIYEGKVKFLLVHPNILSYDSQTGVPDTFAPDTLDRDPDAVLYLQDVSSWGSSVALGESVEAIDRRDSQTYEVKRLKMNAAGTESALWVMGNLNLGAEPLIVDQLDNTNTNLPNDANTFVAAADFANWDRTISGNASSYTVPKYTPITDSNSTSGSGVDEYGNRLGTLYNYAAASAGTYTFLDMYGNGDATSDLCPSGWRIPTGGNGGDIGSLTSAYGLSTNLSSDDRVLLLRDLGFAISGQFDSGPPSGQSGLWGYGEYWTSTFYSTSYMIYSEIYGYRLRIDKHDGRSRGYAVRCLTD